MIVAVIFTQLWFSTAVSGIWWEGILLMLMVSTEGGSGCDLD
jgi:hypothetical protein